MYQSNITRKENDIHCSKSSGREEYSSKKLDNFERDGFTVADERPFIKALEKELLANAGRTRPSTASTIAITASGSATSTTSNSSCQSWPTTKSKRSTESNEDHINLEELSKSQSEKAFNSIKRIESLYLSTTSLNNEEMIEDSNQKFDNSSKNMESMSVFLDESNTEKTPTIDEDNDVKRSVAKKAIDEERSIDIEEVFQVDLENKNSQVSIDRQHSPVPVRGRNSGNEEILHVVTDASQEGTQSPSPRRARSPSPSALVQRSYYSPRLNEKLKRREGTLLLKGLNIIYFLSLSILIL